ncbi:MAG: hypothetical protein ACI8ZB_002594 [Desulforhopalus sp.]|jgi:hypothetical protein
MKKLKWLKAEWPLPIADISKILLDNQYIESKGHGFVLLESNKQKISGKYIERITKTIVSTDPFGNQFESTNVTYYISIFLIDSSSNVIELTDPPRSSRKLLSTLHELLGIGLELSEINVNPLTWLNLFESSCGELLVQSIAASGIAVPENGLARISVSGKKDIRNEFDSLVGNKFHQIDSVKASGVVGDCNVTLELFKNSSAKITGHIFDTLTSSIKTCLERSVHL